MDSSNRPLVSVIVTCYNLESLILQTLESILNQTYTNLEVLVIDDCSSDTSRFIIQQYAGKKPRIRLIENTTNQGALRSKLSGISASRGDYFILCDGDDWVEPSLVEKCIAAIGINDCVIFQFDTINEITGQVWRCLLQENILRKIHQNIELTAFEIGKISHVMPVYFYSSRVKMKYVNIYNGILPIPYFEEIPGYLLTFNKCKVKVISDILYHYRNNRAGQSTETWFETKRICKYQSLLIAIEQSKSKGLFQCKKTRDIAFYKLLNIAYYETIGLCKNSPKDYVNLKKVMTMLFDDIGVPQLIYYCNIRLFVFYYCFRLLPVWVIHNIVVPTYKFFQKLSK